MKITEKIIKEEGKMKSWLNFEHLFYIVMILLTIFSFIFAKNLIRNNKIIDFENVVETEINSIDNSVNLYN